ncbi:S24 family peptidase [uncultured Deinococcus sp.]|uniref:S24 family peptidase n=1 Tax=uncultured Deinococcus sp. TaxID=158789 RepID=UPI00258D9A3F|nr:S24 family peptidase [uncultured Deinococcus sp.]
MHQSYFLPRRYAPSKASVWGFISAGSPSDPAPFQPIKKLPIPQGFRRFGMLAFQITGDSMTLPDGSGFREGDWVLVDRHDLCTDRGWLFAFGLQDGSMIVKRYWLHGGRPAMCSDNPAYDPVKIDSSVRNRGRVYATSRDGRNWMMTKYRGN